MHMGQWETGKVKTHKTGLTGVLRRRRRVAKPAKRLHESKRRFEKDSSSFVCIWMERNEYYWCEGLCPVELSCSLIEGKEQIIRFLVEITN